MKIARNAFLLFVLTFSLLSFADRYGVDDQIQEDAASRCTSDPVCVRLYNKEEAKKKDGEIKDEEWRQRDPFGFYATRGFNIIVAIGIIYLIIKIYCFLFSFGDKKNEEDK